MTRMSHAAPIVMGCGRERLRQRDPLAGADRLIEHVAEAVRLTDDPIPWPIVPVPFPVLAVAVGRDVANDVVAPRQARREVGTGQRALGELYAVFVRSLAATADEREVQLVLAKLHRIANRRHFDEVLAQYPVLLEPDFVELLRYEAEHVGRVEQRAVLLAEADLLDACRAGGVDGGWRHYKSAVLSTPDLRVNPELLRLRGLFEQAVDGDPASAAEIGEQIVALTVSVSNIGAQAAAALGAAICHLRARDERHPERIDIAIRLLERADDLYARHPEVGTVEHRRETLAHLAAAFGERHRGDRAANQRRAIAIHQRLLAETSLDDGPDVWAKTHTHLATTLLQLAQATGDVYDGQVRALDDILEHLHQALRWRSLDRDPLDWAYTQMHLGRAHAAGGGSLEQAVEHYTLAVGGFERAGDQSLAARAAVERASARLNEAFDLPDGDDRRGELSRAAEADARSALRVLEQGVATIADGVAWWQLARALAIREPFGADVRHALERTLEFFTPLTSPERCLSAARILAHAREQAGEQSKTADAWELCAEAAAAAAALHSRREGRIARAREHLGLFAEAAHRVALAGRLERAVEILELGRARELAAWLDQDRVDLDAVGHAEPALRDRYVALRGQLENMQHAHPADGDVDLAMVAEHLAAVIDQVRAIPGMGRFLHRPVFADLLRAAVRGQVIAYPLVGQAGCAWLTVARGRQDPVQLHTLALPAQEARSVLVRIDSDSGEPVGYLPAHRDTDVLDEQIAAVQDVLGPGLMRPLAERLAEYGAAEVCVVALGWLGLVPLHGLSWHDGDGEPQCLLDRAVVSYAPSAYSLSVCVKRAKRSSRRRLLCVGGPLPSSNPLTHAAAEAQIIEELVALADPVSLTGAQATRQAFLDALPDATLVHLACHGSAAVTSDAMQAALWLGDDEPVTAGELVQMSVPARLVVVSACQSAVIEPRAADEALSLSTLFIAAGAAGVVASLWEVDDYATTVLMARMYELLDHGEGSPGRALRDASLWLRDLTIGDERAFLARHARLAALPGAAAALDLAADDRRRQFATPTLWSAFTFTGA